MVLSATREAVERSFSYLVRSVGMREPDRWADRIEDVLKAGPLTASEIRSALDPGDPRYAEGIRYLIGLMAREGRIVRTTVTGGWRSDRVRYARWEDWLPGVDPHGVPADDARAELARWYFVAHGPATVEDFRWWGGLTAAQARRAIDRLGLDEVKVKEAPEPLLGSPGPEPDAPRGTRLLPVWDTALMSHADRSRFVDEARLPYVFDASGSATATVAIDGRVAGVWDISGPDATRWSGWRRSVSSGRASGGMSKTRPSGSGPRWGHRRSRWCGATVRRTSATVRGRSSSPRSRTAGTASGGRLRAGWPGAQRPISRG